MRGREREGLLFAELPAVLTPDGAGGWVLVELDRGESFHARGRVGEELRAALNGAGLGPTLRALGEGHPLVIAAQRLSATPATPLTPAAALTLRGFDTLFVELTGACNERCTHCYAEARPELHDALTRETCEQVLDDAAALGFRRVQLTGGEPLLCDFLDELVAGARVRGVEVVEIFTNGLLLTPERLARLIPHAPSFAFSLYGADPATHDRVTRTAGSHSLTVGAIQRVVKAGLPLRVAVVGTAENAEEIGATIALARELGVPEVSTGGTRAVGRGERFDPVAGCGLEPRRTRDALATHPPSAPSAPSTTAAISATASPAETPSAPERANRGHGSLCVSFRGEVLPCIFNRRDVLGHVPAQRLPEIVAAPRLPGRGDDADRALAESRAELPCLDCQATAFALRTTPCG